jgi:protein transport protein SEC61 subunit gamma-like protein
MEFNELIKRCIRIIYISRKPTPSEYNEVARVAGLGMLLFGVVGLVISLIFGFIG